MRARPASATIEHMRRALAFVLAIWAAAGCSASAPAPSIAPSPTPVAEATVEVERAGAARDDPRDAFRKGPDAQQAPATSAPATGPAAKVEPFLFPHVTTQPARYVTVPMPNTQATAADLSAVAPAVVDWSVVFARGLDGVRYPVQGVDSMMALRALTAENRVARVFERWTSSSVNETVTRTFVATGSRVTDGLTRAWGTMAYVDADIDLVDRGATDIPIHVTLRLRPMGFSFTVMDLFDRTASAWLVGTDSRYSALDLETELPGAASQYLSSESFSPARDPYTGVLTTETPFGKTWNDAILALGALKAAGTISARHFENVTASIDLTGTLVEVTAAGTQRIAFVQPLKFFRTPEGFWTPVDAQEADGTWDSNGDLALADVARPHG